MALLHEVMGADAALAATFAAPVGSPVLHLSQFRLFGKSPIAVLENYLQGEFVDLEAVDLASIRVYLVKGRP